MSSEIARTLTITESNAKTYLSGNGAVKIADDGHIATTPLLSSATGNAVLTSSAEDTLYPNNIAHPTNINVSTYVSSSSVSSSDEQKIIFYVDDTEINQTSGYSSKRAWNFTSTAVAITLSTKNSTIRFYLSKRGGILHSPSNNIDDSLTITLYFTRYDFSAVAGDGVTSASVSSSTGYDGDSITYSCVLASGAEFDGWYDGATRVSTSQSYTITVSGADRTLEARATMPVITKTLSATYNGAQLQGFPISVLEDVPLSYNGTAKGSVPFSGGTKTFACTGKIAEGNIGIGGKTLLCAGKLMQTDVVTEIT